MPLHFGWEGKESMPLHFGKSAPRIFGESPSIYAQTVGPAEDSSRHPEWGGVVFEPSPITDVGFLDAVGQTELSKELSPTSDTVTAMRDLSLLCESLGRL